MLKGLGDIGNLLKIQKDMKSIQKKLKNTKMEGKSSDGLISAEVNGEYHIVSLNIDSSLMNEKSKENVEQMIKSAVNDAVVKIKDFSATEMSRITGGMDLPGFLKP